MDTLTRVEDTYRFGGYTMLAYLSYIDWWLLRDLRMRVRLNKARASLESFERGLPRVLSVDIDFAISRAAIRKTEKQKWIP